jgi:hypothetical protein
MIRTETILLAGLLGLVPQAAPPELQQSVLPFSCATFDAQINPRVGEAIITYQVIPLHHAPY